MSSAPRSISVLVIEEVTPLVSSSSSLNPDWAASFSTKEGSRSMARDYIFKQQHQDWGAYLEVNDRSVNTTNVYTKV